MTVYVDEAIWQWHGRKWCHLVADDIDELHRFARELGLHRISYQGPPKTGKPHYDLTSYERRRAIAYGATACDRTTVVVVLRQLKRQVATSIRHPEVHTSWRASKDGGTKSPAVHPSRLAANAARTSG